jgi:hypothetical protein
LKTKAGDPGAVGEDDGDEDARRMDGVLGDGRSSVQTKRRTTGLESTWKLASLETET